MALVVSTSLGRRTRCFIGAAMCTADSAFAAAFANEEYGIASSSYAVGSGRAICSTGSPSKSRLVTLQMLRNASSVAAAFPAMLATRGSRPSIEHTPAALPSAQLGLWRRNFSSIDCVTWLNVKRGEIFLHKGVYCEVRGMHPAGHGRASTGAYQVRFRELSTRKAREMKISGSDPVSVVTCDRLECPVLYKDEATGKLVVADSNFDEVEVQLSQLGDAAERVEAGNRVSLLMHNNHIVKVVPPPEVAEAVQREHRRARRDELQARQSARQAGEEAVAGVPRRVGADPAAGKKRPKF